MRHFFGRFKVRRPAYAEAICDSATNSIHYTFNASNQFFFSWPCDEGSMLSPLTLMLMGVIGFLIPRTGLLSAQSLNILHVVCVGTFWCMFIRVCLSVLVPVMHYFCTLCVCLCVCVCVCMCVCVFEMQRWQWAAGIKRITTDRQWWQTVKWK